MATHSNTPAWRIPRTGKPGGLPSMGSHRVGHNWSDLAAAADHFITAIGNEWASDGALEKQLLSHGLDKWRKAFSEYVPSAIEMSFPGGASGKNSPANTRDLRDSCNPWVRKTPWRRASNPLQYSCLENVMDRGAWWATVHGFAESDTTEAT